MLFDSFSEAERKNHGVVVIVIKACVFVPVLLLVCKSIYCLLRRLV